MTVHQALWGYSNGHHLLSASVVLSTPSRKMLETLTDLSGSDAPNTFDGYLTGCFLPADGYYALSKTWFAPEMERPGCVWTHTLFLEAGSTAHWDDLDLDSLFRRPQHDKTNYQECYSVPLSSNTVSSSTSSQAETDALALFSNLIRYPEPFLMYASGVKRWNAALEALLILTGPRFSQDISFCTGSLSNRKLGGQPLTLQVVPERLFKVLLRTAPGSRILSIEEKNALQDTVEESFMTLQTFQETRNLLLSCNTEYDNRHSWPLFKEFYTEISNGVAFSFQQAIETLGNQPDAYDTVKILWALFCAVFSQNRQKTHDAQAETLFNFLTLDEQYVSIDTTRSQTLESILTRLWTHCRQKMVDLVPKLLTCALNTAGEVAVTFIVSRLFIGEYTELLRQNAAMCLPMLRLNRELARCETLWQLPKDFQAEALRELWRGDGRIVAIQAEDVAILHSIFRYGDSGLFREVFKTFGSNAIEVYFSYFGNGNSTKRAAAWSGLCREDPVLSVHALCMLSPSAPALFTAVISVLDPCCDEVLSISGDVWEQLYQRFCRNSNEAATAYAQFVLPLILCSNVAISSELLDFSFCTVHTLLAQNSMDYSRWECLSSLLPEIPWYQSWDKCKRLRKAAKQKGIHVEWK